MFGKKDNQNKKIPSASLVATQTQDDIYVMPEKFHPQQNSSIGKSLIVATIILIIIVVFGGSYFLYDMWQQNQAEDSNANLAVGNTNTNINLNTNLNQNINTNINTNDDSNTNNNSNSNLNNNTDSNTNANTNTNTNSNVNLTPPPLSSDADSDGLTDLEENLIGSSISRPDTDSDGYTDGREVIAGYDPLIAGSAKLMDADYVMPLKTTFVRDNFELLTIRDWQYNILESIGEVRITTDTGEIIKLYSQDNSQGVSAINWYLGNNPGVRLSQLSEVEVGDLEGIYSPDGLSVYLTNPDLSKFYIFKYEMDALSQFRYPAIFTFIVKSFRLLTDVPFYNYDGASSGSSVSSTTP